MGNTPQCNYFKAANRAFKDNCILAFVKREIQQVFGACAWLLRPKKLKFPLFPYYPFNSHYNTLKQFTLRIEITRTVE